MHTPARILLPAALLALAACAGESDDATTFADSTATAPAVGAAAQVIEAEGLLTRINALAADSMEGRSPGTPGEEKTVAYLTSQFQALGLEPGNPDGTFIQNVDLIGYTSRPTASFSAGGRPIPARFPQDYVASSRHDRAKTTVEDSEIVFVGYGVVAPEYGWDDYKDVDVSGKTIIMLVNDPAVRSSGDTSSTVISPPASAPTTRRRAPRRGSRRSARA